MRRGHDEALRAPLRAKEACADGLPL
jgi:hypothetical protein